WVHDTTGIGVDVEPPYGPAQLTLTASLVEHAASFGVRASGAEIAVDASAIRGTRPAPDGTYGRGLNVIDEGGARATLSLTGSVVESNMDEGIVVGGGDATIERSVVRDTQPAG